MEMDGHMMVARLTFLESSKDRGSLVTDPSSLVTDPPLHKSPPLPTHHRPVK
jgi:hypothetical protein